MGLSRVFFCHDYRRGGHASKIQGEGGGREQRKKREGPTHVMQFFGSGSAGSGAKSDRDSVRRTVKNKRERGS